MIRRWCSVTTRGIFCYKQNWIEIALSYINLSLFYLCLITSCDLLLFISIQKRECIGEKLFLMGKEKKKVVCSLSARDWYHNNQLLVTSLNQTLQHHQMHSCRAQSHQFNRLLDFVSFFSLISLRITIIMLRYFIGQKACNRAQYNQ